MQKDFDKWNAKKKEIDNDHTGVYIQTKQIWWCSIGLNIGSEQNGHGDHFERPVIIIRKYTTDTFLCLPFTSKEKLGNYFYKINDTLSSVILSQARVLDRKRLTRFIGLISHKEFHDLIERYKNLI